LKSLAPPQPVASVYSAAPPSAATSNDVPVVATSEAPYDSVEERPLRVPREDLVGFGTSALAGEGRSATSSGR
jgi:hypothetical protein